MANRLNRVKNLAEMFEKNEESEKAGSLSRIKPPIAPKPKLNRNLLLIEQNKVNKSAPASLNGCESGGEPDALSIDSHQSSEPTKANEPLQRSDTDRSGACSSRTSSEVSQEKGPDRGSQPQSANEAEQPPDEGEQPPGEAPAKKKDPKYVIEEVVVTERKFVEDLDALKKCHDAMVKANEQQNLGLEKSITDVFSDFHQIYELHKKAFLPMMEDNYEKKTEPWMGSFFKNNSYIVKTYKPFIVRQDENKALLLDLLRNPDIKAALEEVMKDDMRMKLGFLNVYNVIFQRITRYPTLLKEYIKRLPEDCPDRSLAETAMEKITKEALLTNQIKKNAEDFNQTLLAVLDRIIDGRQLPLQPWEKFIKEGPVWKISARRNERLQDRYLFLFSGRLLVCCNHIQSYQKKYSMEVATMHIQEISDPDRHPNSFRIKAKERIIDLKFENQEIANEWADALSRIINEDRERKLSFMNAGRITENKVTLGKEAPEWIKDEHCSMCMICFAKFTRTNRRHHCRACGWLVCGQCSPYKCALEYLNGATERTCKNCKEYFDSGKQVVQKKNSRADDVKIDELLGFADRSRQFKECYVKLLAEGCVHIYGKIKDVKPLRIIPIVGFSITKTDEYEKCIKLSHPSCEYFFIAKSDEKVAIWYDKIKEVIDSFLA